MAKQSIESTMQEEQEKRRLLDLLNQIANSAECGLYYQSTYTKRKDERHTNNNSPCFNRSLI